MYKLLLCWRYLLTRYLALACIISVMLGVATLIVVNSVMSGFSTKLRERLHGLLSDVVVEANGLEGFTGPDRMMARIRAVPYLHDRIAAMTPTMETYAMLKFRYPNGDRVTRFIRLIGLDPKTRNRIGGFKEHLVNQKDRDIPSFEIPEKTRKYLEQRFEFLKAPMPPLGPPELGDPDEPPPPAPVPSKIKMPRGIIIGNLIATYRTEENGVYKENNLLREGDQVVITALAGPDLRPVEDNLVMVDYFKSEMSEYDSQFAFVPLDYLQELRNMPDTVTSIQIKLKDFRDASKVVKEIAQLFPGNRFRVETWEDKQGPLLEAISIEKGILNVLLFLIIGVAGFGILAIFTMIVAEKTRDIGILKALGASNWGVMKIFLGYGFLLGLIGAWLGTLLGYSLTVHINDVEKFLSRMAGTEIFSRKVYYFDNIPTDIQPWMLVWVNVGAVAIAVIFSVLPALRAALLHPVRALRYE